MDFSMTAFRTLTDVAAEITGFTIKYSFRSFFLNIRLEMPGGAESLIRILPDAADFKSIHLYRLPSCQKDLAGS